MRSRALVIVGHGRMALALRASISSVWPQVHQLSARKLLAGSVGRPESGPLLWVLAVPDRHIAPLATVLQYLVARHDVVLHLAGILGPEVLAELHTYGVAVASMHPLAAVAVSVKKASLVGASFLVEGDAPARTEARRIAHAVQGRLIVARVQDRARYHGAAALVATGGVALAQGAAWMLSGATQEPPSEVEIRSAVASLLRSVANNVEAVGVEQALASPLLRNDTTAVARHLEAMREDSTVRALYAAALGRVLKALEGSPLVTPDTLAQALELIEG